MVLLQFMKNKEDIPSGHGLVKMSVQCRVSLKCISNLQKYFVEFFKTVNLVLIQMISQVYSSIVGFQINISIFMLSLIL
jgi:hypothetical protein